ncbi:claudin-15-like isoform X2 [Protopterus annectens]|uniref:claudin-15-like isoform X2 n=1 Tax=Protopterus annectens TaxID=7888 RepID=UPI001CFA20BD|nr:claudin-15-like isoform X2 [Protopterus annectens]
MSAALELTGFLLSLAGWFITGACISNDYWKVSTTKGSVITTSRIYESIWKSCATDSTGLTNCKNFESMLALSGYIQACRALMIVSLIVGILGIILGVLGMKCTNIGNSSEDTKGKIALTGGIGFIVAGLSSLVAVSWYASRVTADFYNPNYAGIKYELGTALYLGWAGDLLLILGGSFLCCSCKRPTKSKHSKGYNYDYKPAQHVPSQIYNKPARQFDESEKAYV